MADLSIKKSEEDDIRFWGKQWQKPSWKQFKLAYRPTDASSRLNRFFSLSISVGAGVLRWRPATKSVLSDSLLPPAGSEQAEEFSRTGAGGSRACERIAQIKHFTAAHINQWRTCLIGTQLSEFSVFSVTSNFSYWAALPLRHHYLPTSIF